LRPNFPKSPKIQLQNELFYTTSTGPISLHTSFIFREIEVTSSDEDEETEHLLVPMYQRRRGKGNTLIYIMIRSRKSDQGNTVITAGQFYEGPGRDISTI